MSMILGSIILDIVIFKWRWCANWILYLESLYVFVTLLLPSKDGVVTDMYTVMIIFTLFLATYTDTQAQVLFLSFI